MSNPFNRGSAPDRARDSWQRPGSFKKGRQKRGGRQKGTGNKLGPDVKRALLTAATLVGDDGAGRHGIWGYFLWLRQCHPTLFYTELWLRLLDLEAYEAARGRGMPVNTESDAEETTEQKIRRVANCMVARAGWPRPDGRKIYAAGGRLAERVCQTFCCRVFDASKGLAVAAAATTQQRDDWAKPKRPKQLYKLKLWFCALFDVKRLIDVRRLHALVERTSIEFIDENGGGPGVRLRKRQQKKS
jgi:hypothetical protein